MGYGGIQVQNCYLDAHDTWQRSNLCHTEGQSWSRHSSNMDKRKWQVWAKHLTLVCNAGVHSGLLYWLDLWTIVTN